MKIINEIKTLKLSASNVISITEIALSIVSILFTSFTLIKKPINNLTSNKQQVYGYQQEIESNDSFSDDIDSEGLVFYEEKL